MRVPRPILALLLSLPGAPLAACGGGGGGGTPPVVASSFHTALAVNDFTGFGTSGGAFFRSTPLAGDTVPASAFRGYIRFDHAGVPAGAVVVSAVLRLYQSAVDGDPYGKFGALHAAHADFGAVLDAADFDGGTIVADLGALATSPALGYVTMDVAARVAADRAAGRTTSDFRIYFNGPLGADGVTDQAYFDSIVPPASEAQLVIGTNGP